MFKTKKEKKAFRIGMIAGKRNCSCRSNAKSNKKKMNVRKILKPRRYGSVKVGNKFYDTNLASCPEITRDRIKELREEYDFNGRSTDEQIVERYVNDMRSKFGIFDKNGKFIGLC